MQEIWRDVPNYKGVYQVSDFGRVKSLRCKKERILKPFLNKDGYLITVLHKGKPKSFGVHSLVAMAFLNHKPNGNKIEVNHKNKNRSDNRVVNLEILTNRQHKAKDGNRGLSKYVGVSWSKTGNKWSARIYVNGSTESLGLYINELDASNAYQKALSDLSK